MKQIILILLLCIILPIRCIDNPVFYRSTFFSGEPRLVKKYLHSFMVNFAGGKSQCAFNRCKQSVPLFDIYGTQNLKNLGSGVQLDPNSPYYTLLRDLPTLSNDPNFGTLSWSAKIDVFEVNFDAIFNFEHGVFIHFYTPLRKISTSGISYKDLSSKTDHENPQWQGFLNSLTILLRQHNLYIRPIDRVGFDSLTFFLGLTKNYIDTKHFDFIDSTAQIGILAPTSKQTNFHNVFDIPLGYNSHFGVRFWGDISCGIFNWLTFGTHGDLIVFLPESKTTTIKTAPQQQGFIKLATANVTVLPYPLFTWNAFIKADHLLYGMSFLLAYSYNKKFKDHLTLCNSHYSQKIANTDNKLRGWSMHTLNIGFEWDFASQRSNGPRIGLSYNRVLSGRTIFNTNTLQGTINIDYVWQY